LATAYQDRAGIIGRLAGKRLVRYDARLDSFLESDEMPLPTAVMP
jgi:hypothetical protein